jgi:periplasmic divalent cation tolerance protein
MSGEAALIWCPFPDAESARVAIGTLLDERLIACGNMVPGVQSLFRWQGDLGESTECGVLCKTAARWFPAAMTRLADLHPYGTPAIAGWTIRVDQGTLAWLEGETGAA